MFPFFSRDSAAAAAPAVPEIRTGRSWRDALLDLLFERSCAACGKPLLDAEPGQYCPDCRAGLPLLTLPYCRLCGDFFPGDLSGEFTCTNCLNRKPHFDWARSAMHYRGAVKDAVRDFKYHAAFWLEREMADWLAALWQTCPEDRRLATAVVPVPMHWTRRRLRGYNQAALLARAFARRVGLPCRPRWLHRSRRVPTQTRLGAAARAENVRGAFLAPRGEAPFHGQRVVLVDDVVTTGATASECAKTLREAGAEWVAVLSVARGG